MMGSGCVGMCVGGWVGACMGAHLALAPKSARNACLHIHHPSPSWPEHHAIDPSQRGTSERAVTSVRAAVAPLAMADMSRMKVVNCRASAGKIVEAPDGKQYIVAADGTLHGQSFMGCVCSGGGDHAGG